jgi:hypothetical protein
LYSAALIPVYVAAIGVTIVVEGILVPGE